MLSFTVLTQECGQAIVISKIMYVTPFAFFAIAFVFVVSHNQIIYDFQVRVAIIKFVYIRSSLKFTNESAGLHQ